MKKLILLMVIPFISFNLNAQCYGCSITQRPANVITDFNKYFAGSQAVNFASSELTKNIVGEFSSATLSLNDDTKVYLTRYNPLSNEMEIKDEDGLIYNLRKFTNLKVTFAASNESYQALVFKDSNGELVVDFFNLPNSQDGTLLKQTAFSYVKSKKAKSSYDKDRPAYYKEKIQYYFVDQDNYLVKLTTKKRDVKSMYKLYSKEILAYIKTNKIEKSKEQDLLKLATFMKSLQVNNSVDSRLVTN